MLSCFEAFDFLELETPAQKKWMGREPSRVRLKKENEGKREKRRKRKEKKRRMKETWLYQRHYLTTVSPLRGDQEQLRDGGGYNHSIRWHLYLPDFWRERARERRVYRSVFCEEEFLQIGGRNLVKLEIAARSFISTAV